MTITFSLIQSVINTVSLLYQPLSKERDLRLYFLFLQSIQLPLVRQVQLVGLLPIHKVIWVDSFWEFHSRQVKAGILSRNRERFVYTGVNKIVLEKYVRD